MTIRIFVSACLVGQTVRYDGRAKTFAHPLIEQWRDEGRLVTMCPEVAAGFSVPRPPAEIAPGATADTVLAGDGRIVEKGGLDVTDRFLVGAELALDVALRNGCRFALMTDGSPSCGTRFVHAGQFDGRRRDGQGVVAARFVEAGIRVFPAEEIEALAAALAQSERSAVTAS